MSLGRARRFFAIVPVLALSACAQPQGEGDGDGVARPQIVVAPGPFTHRPSGMTFPDQVGQFRRVALIRYDEDGLNVSAGYLASAPNPIIATVYVYPAPAAASVGSDTAVRERECQDEFGRNKADIKLVHPDADLVEEQTISMPRAERRFPGKLASYEFADRFGNRRVELTSQLYLFCYVGGKWAVKYRFTWPRDAASASPVISFMGDLPWTIAEMP